MKTAHEKANEAQRLAELEWVEDQILFWRGYIVEKERKGEYGLARRAREALARAEEQKRQLKEGDL